ncbi:MAG: hypothetical protein Tsb0020_41390 [Haliangiales bacterium]
MCSGSSAPGSSTMLGMGNMATALSAESLMGSSMVSLSGTLGAPVWAGHSIPVRRPTQSTYGSAYMRTLVERARRAVISA